MKKVFLIALVAISFAACQNSGKSNTELGNTTEITSDQAVSEDQAAVMSFESENYNFGTISQGEKISYSYKVKNVGKSPLIIMNATATCGCTIPEIPAAPIKPGEEGEIKVVFDSNGKIGMQDKVITVLSNAHPNTASLHLTGEIKD